METTIKFNPNPGNIAKSAFIIEKVHRCADCPIRKMAIKQPQSIFARLHRWTRPGGRAGKPMRPGPALSPPGLAVEPDSNRNNQN